jgi:hypothetical protein
MKAKDLWTQSDTDKIKNALKVRKGASSMVRTAAAHEDKSKFNPKKDRRSFKDQFRKGMFETQVLTNVRLTDHQKSVMANVIARGNQNTTLIDLTANVDDINKQNMSGAVNTLAKIGLMAIDPNKTVTVTDEGNNIMAQENLVDDGGQLTPDGQKYQFMFTRGEEGKDQQDVDQEMAQTDMSQGADALGMGGDAAGAAPAMDSMGGGGFGESFSLIKNMIDQQNLEVLKKKFTSQA